jgi:Immunity protein Imm1
MSRVDVRWSSDPAVPVDSVEELDRVLDRVALHASGDQPVIVALDTQEGTLTLGLGHETSSVLVYYPPGYDGLGSLHSVGDRGAAERDEWRPPLTFFYFGHHSEFPRWSGVPVVVARQAAREFFERPGEPPARIDWEED